MRFDVLTLFPEMLDAVLHQSIIGRGSKNGIIELNFINIRNFAFNKHRHVDDYPYGGGKGMLMQAEPIFLAYQSLLRPNEVKPLVIYLSPQGKVFNQQMAVEFSQNYSHIVLLCGHYEGVDQRVIDKIVDTEVSIGDFVMTGGEIGAMAIIDATARLLDGVLSDEECYINESHNNGLLEHPQYTRPNEFMGESVPDVLTNGNHKLITEWCRKESLRNTFLKRPDMLKKAPLTKSDMEFLKTLI